MFNEKDFLSFANGTITLTGLGVILLVVRKFASPKAFTLSWLRPGTWVAAFFWKLAQYATAFARAVDMFVVEYRQSKKELDEEILRCEE